jgi:hypothetical protein
VDVDVVGVSAIVRALELVAGLHCGRSRGGARSLKGLVKLDACGEMCNAIRDL